MKICMVRPYGMRNVGDVVDMPDGQASLWLSLGYATAHRQQEAIETATLEERAETPEAPRKARGKS